jgi:arginine repressor
MLNDLLQDLKKAILNNDIRAQKALIKELNHAGMDVTTIKILLKEI